MTDKPSFDVAVVGLDAERLRLIEIVFRHIRYNRYGFRLLAPPIEHRARILVAGVDEPAGLEAIARARASTPPLPAIAVVSGGGPAPVRHAIDASQLVRQLLPILNRLVEIEGLAPSPADPIACAEPATPVRDDRPRVLVIEDSATVRAQLADAFGRMGLAVEEATTAGEAMQRLQSQHVDLAMLDLGLPDLDGLQLARRIRREPRWRALPIVALSSRTSPLDIVRGAAAGCDAYLGKPVGFTDLRRTVAGQLGRVLAADALPSALRTAPA